MQYKIIRVRAVIAIQSKGGNARIMRRLWRSWTSNGCPNVLRLHLLWWQQQRWDISDCQAGSSWACHRQRGVVGTCDVGRKLFNHCTSFPSGRFVYHVTAKKRHLKCLLRPNCIGFGNAIHLISFGLKSIASVMTRESTGSEWLGQLYSYRGRGRPVSPVKRVWYTQACIWREFTDIYTHVYKHCTHMLAHKIIYCVWYKYLKAFFHTNHFTFDILSEWPCTQQ